MPASEKKPCPKCANPCAVMVEGVGERYDYRLECFECKAIVYGREAEKKKENL